MIPDKVKEQLEDAVALSTKTNTVCKVTITGYGCFRVDGSKIVLIKEDGSYQRVTQNSIDNQLSPQTSQLF